MQAAEAARAGHLYGGTIMKVLNTVVWTTLGLATLITFGCVRSYERERVVVERRPEPVRREVIVERAPPPPRPTLEVRVR
jgi:hypothetical protein